MSHHFGSPTSPLRGRLMHRAMASLAAIALLASMTVAWPAPAGAVGHLTISIADGGPVVEGDDGKKQISFEVSIDPDDLPPETDIEFTWKTGSDADPDPDTATAGEDYDAVVAGTTKGTGTIESPSVENTEGEKFTTVTVDLIGDVDIEDDETFTVQLEAVTSNNADIDDGEAIGTIENDDPKVSVTEPEVDVAEGDDAMVGIELTAPAQADTLVTYTVADGSATATDDYTPPDPAEVTIPAGASTAVIEIPTAQGPELEEDETFTVELTDIAPGDLAVEPADLVATVTILDDRPRVSIADAEVVEGHDGTTEMAFTVQVTPTPDGPATVQATTGDGDDENDATEQATEGDDYVGASDETLTFDAANGFQATFVVEVVGDVDGFHGAEDPETDETFFVHLSEATGPAYLPPDTSAIGTILDDDGLPEIWIDDASVEEGAPGETPTMSFTVTLSEPSGGDITLAYETADGDNSATRARDGSTESGDHDFDPIDGAQFVVPAGTTEVEVPVTIVGDDKHEVDELFEVTLAAPSDIDDNPPFELADGTTDETKTDEATGTIVNDDAEPTVIIRDRTFAEGDDGLNAQRNVEVTLSHLSSLDVDVTYATRDGTATVDDGDYTESEGTVTLNGRPGRDGVIDTDVIQIETHGDDLSEPNEHFFVDPSNPINGQIADDGSSSSTMTLLNDDGPRLTIDDVEVDEGDTGTTDVEFTVTLVEPEDEETSDGVSVDWTTVDGSAVAGTDYQAASGTLEIAAGETAGTITVTVVGNFEHEPNRTFGVHLTDAVGATVFDDEGLALIRDDDAGRPTASIADPPDAVEGSAVTLDASASADPDGAIVSYAWDLGDGSDPVTTSSPTVTHTYGDDGTYTVELTVTDNDDLAASTTRKVAVTNAAPTVEAGPDMSVEVRRSVTLQASGSDPGDDELTYSWDLGDGSDATGEKVTHTYTDAGKHTVTVTVRDGDGGKDSDTLVVDVAPDVGEVDRLSGGDRIATALEVSRAGWPSPDDGTPASRDVVLATAWNYPDALAGGTLAALLGAPILLTDADQLPAAVASELDRLGSTRVWILGGEAAVSQGVANQAAGNGRQVFRLEGGDRFETAATVARATGASDAGEVVIALGAHEVADRAWPDAVSAGALASAPDPPPVLLTLPDALPPSTEQALADIETQTIYLVGGTAAIAPSVADHLTGLGYEVIRLSGGDRYATSLAVAELALSRHGADSNRPLVFATGAAFPDGLTATALAARLAAVVVLVPHGDVPEATGTFLTDGADRFDEGWVVGGTAVVSDAVRDQLRAAITSG